MAIHRATSPFRTISVSITDIQPLLHVIETSTVLVHHIRALAVRVNDVNISLLYSGLLRLLACLDAVECVTLQQPIDTGKVSERDVMIVRPWEAGPCVGVTRLVIEPNCTFERSDLFPFLAFFPRLSTLHVSDLSLRSQRLVQVQTHLPAGSTPLLAAARKPQISTLTWTHDRHDMNLVWMAFVTNDELPTWPTDGGPLDFSSLSTLEVRMRGFRVWPTLRTLLHTSGAALRRLVLSLANDLAGYDRHPQSIDLSHNVDLEELHIKDILLNSQFPLRLVCAILGQIASPLAGDDADDGDSDGEEYYHVQLRSIVLELCGPDKHTVPNIPDNLNWDQLDPQLARILRLNEKVVVTFRVPAMLASLHAAVFTRNLPEVMRMVRSVEGARRVKVVPVWMHRSSPLPWEIETSEGQEEWLV